MGERNERYASEANPKRITGYSVCAGRGLGGVQIPDLQDIFRAERPEGEARNKFQLPINIAILNIFC